MLHKWIVDSYGSNYTIYCCERCGKLHKSIADEPDTWLSSIERECSINKDTENEMGNR